MKKILISVSVIFLLLTIGCNNKPEVVELESGLRYLDDSLGTGREAKVDELVTIHFNGWMVMDTTGLFSDWSNDQQKRVHTLGNSKERNQPVKFILGTGSFIKGSEDGIEGMRVGGRRTIIIPAELAYGEKGMGFIPPNTDLKLVIELLDVKDKIVVEFWDVDPNLIQTTKSGIKYAILQDGEGERADSGKVVTVHYTGYLEDGTKFDSSFERDDPLSFVLGMGHVFPGWDEGLMLLKKGTKARLILPPDLAYGEMEVEKIPANSTLIFDIEMLDIQ